MYALAYNLRAGRRCARRRAVRVSKKRIGNQFHRRRRWLCGAEEGDSCWSRWSIDGVRGGTSRGLGSGVPSSTQ